MKIVLILACLALFVSCTQSQRSCRGTLNLNQQNCVGGRDSGTSRGRNCRGNANNRMWWWDSRTRSCRRMRYLGCRGNRNRYCSLQDCQWRCLRRTRPTRPTAAPAPQPSTAAPTESPTETTPEPSTAPTLSPIIIT